MTSSDEPAAPLSPPPTRDDPSATKLTNMGEAFVSPLAIQEFIHRFLHRARDGGVPKNADDIFGFMAFANRHVDSSKSQLFQDLWVLWEHGTEAPGYFVEIGGGDGVNLSNCYLLEKQFGWHGIIAEPNRSFRYSIAINRSCTISHKAVTDKSGERVAFLEAGYGEMSRLRDVVPADGHEISGARFAEGRQQTEVETISLHDLLTEAQAPARIDYLSIDTEGSELLILEGFDFERWDVRLISVEHNYTRAQQDLHRLLTSHGYRRKWPSISRFDSWYVKPAAQPDPVMAAGVQTVTDAPVATGDAESGEQLINDPVEISGAAEAAVNHVADDTAASTQGEATPAEPVEAAPIKKEDNIPTEEVDTAPVATSDAPPAESADATPSEPDHVPEDCPKTI